MSHLMGRPEMCSEQEDLNLPVFFFFLENLEPEVMGLHVVKQNRAGRLCTWHRDSPEA